MVEDYPEIEPGDIDGLLATYPHVREWVVDFESRYGKRPIYYGPLDRAASKLKPLNLIYVTKPPLFVHVYRPENEEDEDAGRTLWFGLEPQLNEEDELIRRALVELLLQEAPAAPSFTTDSEF